LIENQPALEEKEKKEENSRESKNGKNRKKENQTTSPGTEKSREHPGQLQAYTSLET